MKQATTDLSTKAARKRLPPRAQAYFRTINPGKALGYLRRADQPGSWLVREKVKGIYRFTTFATADDATQSNNESVLTYEQAMKKAAGIDAAAAPAASSALTIVAAVDRYYDILKADKPHADEYRRGIKKHLTDELAGTRVDRVTSTQLKQWLASLVLADPKDPDARRLEKSSANRVLTMLKAPLNAAFEDESNGIPSSAAWDRVSPFEDADQARTDDLDATQVRLLIAKAASFDQDLANLIEATYLIGCRAPGELAGVTVADLDVAGHCLSIPRGKTGKRPVTLSNEAVAFFARLAKDKLPGALLVPRADGKAWTRSGHFRWVKRAVELAGLAPSVSLYTLRHAYISRAIEAGMPLSLIAENCGTSLLMIQRNYAKVLASTRKELVQKTAPQLRVVA